MESPAAPPDPNAVTASFAVVEEILPQTWRFLATLPADCRLVECVKSHPRIVNHCAALRMQPEKLDQYLQGLLVDQRGNRRGFPMNILTELTLLREHLMRSRPDRYKIYDLRREADGSLVGTWHSSERSAPGAVPQTAAGDARFASLAELMRVTGLRRNSPVDEEVEVYLDGERLLQH